MASIVAPPRIDTLNPQPIRVIVHTSFTTTTEFTIPNVFPFMTLYNLKQRLARHNSGQREWMHVFVAQAQEDGRYKPLEFSWPFGKLLQDPLEPTNIGKPDVRIYEGGDRKPIFPTILTGITIETAMEPPANTVHVWTLKRIANAAGYDEGTAIRDDAYEGFFQLFFPTLKSKDDIAHALSTAPLTKKEQEYFEVADQFCEYMDTRLMKLEANLGKTAPVTLRELRYLRYTLPKKAAFATGQLELKFYETEPSETLPFMRFFSANDRVKPLVKLATNKSGAPYISDKKLLDSFMAEQPATTMGSIVIFKSPIQSARAPLGTAWTLRIFEDGSADLYIGAPRKDAPLSAIVVNEAVRMLPEFLATTPWADTTDMNLAELTAVYEFKSEIAGGKPPKSELRRRLDTFLPVFMEEKGIAGDTSDINLRFKAVSNFVKDKDPIYSYITTLFLRDSNQSVESVPVDKYITAIGMEFGIPPTDAAEYVKTWISSHAEYVLEDTESAVASRNLGAALGIYVSHPKYLFLVSAIESQTDLNRITSLLALFTSMSATELGVAENATEAEAVIEHVEEVVEEAVEEAVEEDAGAGAGAGAAAWNALLDFGMASENEVLAEGQELAPAKVVDEAPVVQLPKPLAVDEMVPAVEKEWYLKRLGRADSELFEYKEIKDNPRVTIYSVACQKSAGKQPNVMDYRSYQRARTLYGNAVFWLEAPLSTNDTLALRLASKTPGERKKEGTMYKKNVTEVIEYEKRALSLGIPLSSSSSKGVTVTSLTEVERGVRAETKMEIADLILAQKSKPLWSVVRTGSREDEPNYYICAELWCIRDDLPIIPSEFAGVRMRDGAAKAANSCPFCGGLILTDPTHPKIGETVLRRKPTDKSGNIAQYVGFQKTLYHPSNYALPCCFTSPNNLEVPAGAMPIPPPKVPLPDLQREGEVVSEVASEATEVVRAPAVLAPEERENRDRPFSPTMKKRAAQNRWFIPNQNIKGRDRVDWIELEKGTVATPPPAVNALLGQDPEKFLTKIKGAMGGGINSYLATPASAFIRYSIGNSTKEPGANLISLLAFAKYATKHYLTQEDDLSIPSNAEVLDEMLEKKGPLLSRAFEQANYGTLLHEFSVPGTALQAEAELEFQTWWGKTGVTEADQRAYAVNVFLAWKNFQNYVRDTKEPKELRLWEGLFATPGLLTDTGFVIVKIQFSKKKQATIRCPEFGVSLRSQLVKPPILFIVEDEVSGQYDPLVFYNGETKETRQIFGVLQETAQIFGTLPAHVREPLQAFLEQYYSTDGCARSATTVHPWMPERSADRIPLLGSFVTVAQKLGFSVNARLHDRSNRCVGLIIREQGDEHPSQIYIPVLDDGTILSTKSVLRGEHALPYPPLQLLLEVLTGKQAKITEKRLVHEDHFPALLPVRLVASTTEYIAVELACGATIPIEPLALGNSISHRRFTDMQKHKKITTAFKTDMPWHTDITLLGPTVSEDDLAQTQEETLEEAYQHLRISFSNWLHTSEMGGRVRRQIDLLRLARRRLPLFELQKRLDILLTPIVNNSAAPWMTLEGTTRPSVLRRDCRQIQQESACVGGCTWSVGRCLIHTTTTPRYMNPLRLLTARLGDELLRSFGHAMEVLEQRVPHLNPISQDALVHLGSSVLFSATGRGTEALYEKLGYTERKPGEFTRGFTYPEEIGVEPVDEIPADWSSVLRKPVFGADVARDARTRLVAALVAISGVAVPANFTGTRENWRAFALSQRNDIIVTQGQEPTERIVGNEGAGVTRFIVLDSEGVPLQRIDNGTYVSTAAQLPPRLRDWIDAHGGA